MTRRCAFCGFVTDDHTIELCPTHFAPLAAAPSGTLRLAFHDGTVVEVPAGEEVRLGRDPDWSERAGWLSAFPRVSRRHATVGLRANGTAWILPEEGTANGTYLDGHRVEPGRSAPLPNGSLLRLSSQLSAQITIDPGE
ncbi:FHA domain-containing protein [Spongiactinospora sp. TRM90649]|uniref:FHA domain-containing protein n=1 Tax=Spongiactinospora sp. TRM90649 TaxID=3031114 RepID=UPI0023F780D6|nr:FHA domain-containing protein [Spongiactinospora sp. TRM90649]MDF5757502.1 FHA domain-containing protein [Spongiactinospora sp. TRM90649]